MAKPSKNDPLVRLLSIPNNYKWSELIKLLGQLGYKKLERRGSRVAFYNSEKDCLLNLHKPHPGNITKKGMLRKVVKHLQENGVINEK